MLYISMIKRTYKSWYNDKIDSFDTPDISKSIQAVVDIIENTIHDIIENLGQKVVLLDLISTMSMIQMSFQHYLKPN